MITAILVTIYAEIKVLKYATSSEDDACRMLVEDWKKGKIIWECSDTNLAFSKSWLDAYGLEPISDLCDKQYENNVRVVTWHYCGESESEHQIVSCYFVHSTK